MYGAYNASNSMIQYVVKKNDSLYMIAKQYNTTVDELKEVNHLYSNTIYPNQILFIPVRNSSNADCKTYLTTDGESIGNILKKHNITLSSLERMNDVDKIKVEGNQLLCVDYKNKNTHTVVATDTIDSILRRYGLTAMELLLLNQNTILEIGKEIIVG